MNVLSKIALTLLLLLSCKQKADEIDNNIIVDYFPEFNVKITRPVPTVPDSLGGTYLKGIISLDVTVDSAGSIFFSWS